LRFVKTIGYRPVLAGNIKGLQDHYRTPETQKGFAEQNKQKPKMVTSFADGTKISMEMAVVANATGFGVGTRGMHGPRCKHVTEALNLFPAEQMLNGGLVDYVLGAEPGPGVFVIGYNDHPIKQQYATISKWGTGRSTCFTCPYHLPHLEAPITVARAVLFGDAAVAPIGAPVCEVLTMAKRDLKTGRGPRWHRRLYLLWRAGKCPVWAGKQSAAHGAQRRLPPQKRYPQRSGRSPMTTSSCPGASVR
jgi:predicted homoserine dehydrogenase-like protein